MGKFEIFQGRDGRFYFHLKAANGEIVAASQGYTTKQHAEAGVESVRASAPMAEVIDLTGR